MTTTKTITTLYRALLREAQYPTKLIQHLRSLAETNDKLLLQNAIYFMRAQRLHSVLHDLFLFRSFCLCLFPSL